MLIVGGWMLPGEIIANAFATFLLICAIAVSFFLLEKPFGLNHMPGWW
jgi:hypothetical protein